MDMPNRSQGTPRHTSAGLWGLALLLLAMVGATWLWMDGQRAARTRLALEFVDRSALLEQRAKSLAGAPTRLDAALAVDASLRQWHRRLLGSLAEVGTRSTDGSAGALFDGIAGPLLEQAGQKLRAVSAVFARHDSDPAQLVPVLAQVHSLLARCEAAEQRLCSSVTMPEWRVAAHTLASSRSGDALVKDLAPGLEAFRSALIAEDPAEFELAKAAILRLADPILVAEWEAPPPPTQEGGSIALVLVVDRSGSMGNVLPNGRTKMSYAKNSALRTAQVLGDGDQVAIVTYGNKGQGRIELPMTAARSEAAVQSGVEQLAHARELTFLLGGLQVAEQLLRGTTAAVKHVVVITDGEFDTSEDIALRALARRMRDEQEASVSVIAITDAFTGSGFKRLSEELTRDGGGRFVPTDDPTTVPVFVVAEVTRALQRVGRRARAPAPAAGATGSGSPARGAGAATADK
jgi:Mg-chelatase subunit ChlD